jgi:hypothetical protein
MSTIEVVNVTGASAKLGIYSRDHCPPHATCRDLAGQWTIRISFSFLDNVVRLLSVLPAQNNPGFRVINELAQAVQRNLEACRRLWWGYQQNTQEAAGPCCLNNQTVRGGTIIDAIYDPATCHVRLRYLDGTTVEQVV